VDDNKNIVGWEISMWKKKIKIRLFIKCELVTHQIEFEL